MGVRLREQVCTGLSLDLDSHIAALPYHRPLWEGNLIRL